MSKGNTNDSKLTSEHVDIALVLCIEWAIENSLKAKFHYAADIASPKSHTMSDQELDLIKGSRREWARP